MSTREDEVPQTVDRFERVRQRLDQAAAEDSATSRMEAVRRRLQEAQAPPGTPDGDPDPAAVEEPDPTLQQRFFGKAVELIGPPEFAQGAREPGDEEQIPDFFTEPRGRLGLLSEGARGLARVPGQFIEGAGGMAQAAAVANAELSADGSGFQETMSRMIESAVTFQARAAEMFVKDINALEEMFSEAEGGDHA